MKSYNTYWVDYSVRGLHGSLDSDEVVSTIIFFGIRLQDVFLSQQGLGNGLGFDNREAILERLVDKEKPTFLKLNTQSDAARIGLIRELNITIIPKHKGLEVYPYLNKYKTTLPYNGALNIRQVVETLYSVEWSLGEVGNTAVYIVEPGSVKEKKSKRTTASYS